METELDGQQTALDNGEIPLLGDIHKLAKTAQKIYRVLQLNDLIID